MASPRNRLALDIRDRRVVLALAARDGTVQSVFAAAIETNGKHDEASERAATVASVRRLVAAAGVSGREVALALPRGDAVMKHIRLPDSPASEIASLVRYQAERLLPFPLEQAVHSHVVLGKAEDGGVEVVVAGARRGAVSRIVQIAEEAGLKVGGVTVAPLPAVRALRRAVPESATGTAVLIDVSERVTEIAVLRDGRLVASRAASVGAVAAANGNGNGADVDEDASRAAARIAGEVTRTVHAWSADLRPDRAWLTGARAGADLAAALGERLGVPVTLFAPSVPAGKGGDAAANGAGAATAVGLLGDAGAADLAGIDLAAIAPTRRAKSARRQRAFLAAIAAALAVAALAMGWQRLRERETTVESLRATLAELQPTLDQYEMLARRIRDVRAWERRRPLALEALLAVTDASPEDPFLTSMHLGTGGRVRLVGRAKDESVVKELLAGLAKAKIKASFESFVRRPDKPDEEGGEFVITALLPDEMGPP